MIPIITRVRGRDSWPAFYAALCRQQGSTVSGLALRALYNAPESEELRQQFRNTAARVDLDTLHPEPAVTATQDVPFTPVKKRRTTASEQCIASPTAVASGLETTPQLGLTPASAMQLAQSCRKTPRAPMGCPEEPCRHASAPPHALATWQGQADDRLLAGARPYIRQLYEHFAANNDAPPSGSHNKPM